MPWATIDIRNGIYWFGFFGFLWRSYNRYIEKWNKKISDPNWRFWAFFQFYGTHVVSSENQNMTDPQNKLLLWHCKLGINMYPHTSIDERENNERAKWFFSFLPHFILPKLKYTSKCPVHTFTSCLLERQNKRSIETKKQTISPRK